MGEPQVSSDGDTVVFTAIPTTGPADAETSVTIDQVRERHPGQRLRLRDHCITDDLTAQLSDTLPLFIGAVIASRSCC